MVCKDSRCDASSLRSLNPADLAKLAVSLQQDPRVLDYRIAPTSE